MISASAERMTMAEADTRAVTRHARSGAVDGIDFARDAAFGQSACYLLHRDMGAGVELRRRLMRPLH